jgi:hypothetical protein
MMLKNSGETMETIKDMWASLVAYANERSTNPLTSAFFLTWAGWNYKFFVVLFNNETSAEKFAAIDSLYPRPDTYLSNGLLFPALTTLFYVFLYPYITGWVVTFYRRRQVAIANSIREVEGERVRTVEEVANLVRGYEKRLTAADLDQKAARAEAGELRNALTAAEAELKKTNNVIRENPRADEGDVVNAAPSSSTDELNDELLLPYTIKSSGKDLAGVVTVRQAKVLLLLTEKDTFAAHEIPEFLEISQSDSDEALIRLRKIGAIDRTSSAIQINDVGRSILRTLIEQGRLSSQRRKLSKQFKNLIR